MRRWSWWPIGDEQFDRSEVSAARALPLPVSVVGAPRRGGADQPLSLAFRRHSLCRSSTLAGRRPPPSTEAGIAVTSTKHPRLFPRADEEGRKRRHLDLQRRRERPPEHRRPGVARDLVSVHRYVLTSAEVPLGCAGRSTTRGRRRRPAVHRSFLRAGPDHVRTGISRARPRQLPVSARRTPIGRYPRHVARHESSPPQSRPAQNVRAATKRIRVGRRARSLRPRSQKMSLRRPEGARSMASPPRRRSR